MSKAESGKVMMIVITVIIPLDCDPNKIDERQYIFGRDKDGKVRTFKGTVDSVLDTNYTFGQ